MALIELPLLISTSSGALIITFPDFPSATCDGSSGSPIPVKVAEIVELLSNMNLGDSITIFPASPEVTEEFTKRASLSNPIDSVAINFINPPAIGSPVSSVKEFTLNIPPPSPEKLIRRA